MGFGFVVARFGLFLQQLQLVQHAAAVPSQGLSTWFGTALIGVGVIVNLVDGRRHARLLRALHRGEMAESRPSSRVIMIAFFLALVGLAMAIYLVWIQTSTGMHLPIMQEISMTPHTDNGIIDKLSDHSVDDTVAMLKQLLEAKGIALFALIDHSGEAEKVGLKMRPTKLLIFGSPKAGTPVMLAAPRSAIDLPLKILVWQDADAKTWVSYNSPAYLQQRHGFPSELLQNISAVEVLAAKAAE
jgi:uncharacterized protein (DUF302 family)/uncharacterized membrane protein YidH (DUF202 family)